jgi:hypothetical protein
MLLACSNPCRSAHFAPHFTPQFMWDVAGFGKTALDEEV